MACTSSVRKPSGEMKAQLLTSSFLLEAEHIAPIGYGKRATWIKKNVDDGNDGNDFFLVSGVDGRAMESGRPEDRFFYRWIWFHQGF